jgi:hypothetical protein
MIFAMEAFNSGSSRVEAVAHGSIYVGAYILVIVINAAFISPALLLLQPRKAWRIWRNERVAITPRQRFRGVYLNLWIVHDPRTHTSYSSLSRAIQSDNDNGLWMPCHCFCSDVRRYISFGGTCNRYFTFLDTCWSVFISLKVFLHI